MLNGTNAPNLRNIAVNVLSQTTTTSGCERNWSTFNLIHIKRRNRLRIARLNDLVFVHYIQYVVENETYQREKIKTI